LFTVCRPGARIAGRFPGAPRLRGKHFTIDIHCYVHTPKADEMVKGVFTIERAFGGNARTAPGHRALG
jgi:hypothetical protein